LAVNKRKYEAHVLYGFTVQEIIMLSGMGIGLILVIGGLVFLVIEYFIGIHPAEIELPEWLGKIKIKVPSGLAAILVGGVLVGYSVLRAHDAPPKHAVSGKIQVHKGKQVSTPRGIMVGILPASHVTQTGSDGSYFLDIPKGEHQYQTVVSYQGKFDMGVVTFKENGQGTFDYTFDEGSVKK
jgi:hypothetical protein